MPTAPAAAVPAPSARPAPPLTGPGKVATRADIVRLAQTGGPWAFLPLGLAALRDHPDDHEVRFLVGAAFARLALVTPARDHLALLPGELRADPAVAALLAAIARLGDDRIHPAMLAETCRGNVEALARRGVDAVELRAHLPAWERRAGGWEWFRAHDGNIVRRERVSGGAPAGVGDRWVHLADIRREVASATLPHAGPGAAGPRAPCVVEGLDPPWLAERVLRETPAAGDGYHARVTIVQEDPLELLDGLAQADLRARLSEARVRVIVGPDAGGALARRLLSALDTRAVGSHFSLSGVRTPASPPVQQVLALAARAQEIEQQQLAARVAAVYAGRDRAWWARRYAGASAASPLRVLVPTCRFSTYIRHAAADLAAAFGAIGCESRVLIEPDDHSHFSGVAYLRAIAEFEPDLVVLINYARSNINGTVGAAAGKGAPELIPANVPYVMWLQDTMPHQIDERVGRGMTDLDFVAGNLREELFWRFAYPRARSMDAPIVASGSKFHDGPVTVERRSRHACEVAYVSHHSETPEAMHARKCAEASGTPGLAALLEDLRAPVEREAAAAAFDPLSLRLRRAVVETLRRTGRSTDDPRTIEQIVQFYALPQADRIMRHQTLAWAAEIADRRGWRMHVYGRGWGGHPTLARLARGELDHGEDLRASYRCAAAHLQVSAHTIIHQRVMECALAGGLPIGRVTEEDLSTLQFGAAMHAARRALAQGRGPDACAVRRIAGTRHYYAGYSLADCPEAMSLACLRQRLGEFRRGEGAADDQREAFVWINSVHVERLTGVDATAPPERSITRLFADPADFLFTDRDGLERALVRAVEDPAWRTRVAGELRRRVGESMTHEAFARRLTAFVGASLRGDPPETTA